MRHALLLSSSLAGLLSATPGASAADASKDLARLEAARNRLAQAVKLIQVDPPSTADLDAAHVAAETLKDVLAAGAPHEADDLDYAKAALSARKELRTQREYIDDRRAKVHIHDQRRLIDQAMKDLVARVRTLASGQPASKDFEDARAAVAAVKKAVDDGRPFVQQDAAFAKYIEQTDGALAQQQKAIDDRRTQVSVDQQRGALKASRQALSDAMSAVEKGGSDGRFEAAGRAVTALSSKLDEGKALEPKDKAYRDEAERGRAELAQARRRTDELFSKAALTRLTSDIDPAYKQLVEAAKALRGPNATEDQLAEAKTAAIVVRKLVEKFQPQAEVLPALAKYLAQVKGVLVGVEVDLQRRSLTSARKDLAQALKDLAKSAPTDEQFEVAKTAQVVLEKTLGTVHADEPALAKLVAEAKALLQESQTGIPKRRLELDVQRQRALVEEARKNAATVMGQLTLSSKDVDRPKEAEDAVKQIAAALEKGAALTKKDPQYATYDIEVKKRIAELNERIANRRQILALSAAHAALKDGAAMAKAKIDAAKAPSATDAEVEDASKSLEALTKALDSQAPFEKQDRSYAEHADRTRDQLTHLTEAFDLVSKTHSLRKETSEGLSVGSAAMESAAAAGDIRARKAAFEKATTQLARCQQVGQSLARDNSSFAATVVLVQGSPITLKEATSQCEEKAKSAGEQLAQVKALVDFEDGPRRTYEAGKSLVARGKKTEALDQFNDCIVKAVTLRMWHPELADHPFQIGGSTMSLTQTIEACTKQRDAIKPFKKGG